MPPSKNAFIRYRIIDQCLRDEERNWSKKDITNRVNRYLSSLYGYTVTESAIRHDLDDIEIHFKLEIDRYPAKAPVYYRYKDPETSLFNLPLDKSDIAKITKAMELLSSVKGLELDEELKPALASLQNRTMIKSPESKRVLHFDQQPFANGSEYVNDLLQSIQQRTPLKFKYLPFNLEEAFFYHFHPYILKEYNKRWFSIGFCSKINKLVTIGLDRIIGDLTVLKQEYIDNSYFDPDEYFADIVGVTRPENTQRQKIRLEFSKERFPYVNNKYIHESQVVEKVKANGRGVISLQVIPNKELVSYILSFGRDVVVLSPKNFAEQIKMELKKAAENYK